MARGAAAETNPSIWRYWAAWLTLQRAILQEQFLDLQGKRERAQKRAKAAEIIAQEANTARLKTLLDAAREQATVRTIESAEQRFANARGDFETAHQAFAPAGDVERRPERLVGGPTDAAPSGTWSTEVALAIRPTGRRRVSAGVVVAGVAALSALALATYYLLGDTDSGGRATVEARETAPQRDMAAIAPRAPAPQPQAPVETQMPPVSTVPAAITAPDPVQTRSAEPVATVSPVQPAEPAALPPTGTAEAAGSALPAEPAPIRTAAEVPPVPLVKPARTMPSAPPAPGPNPFRIEAFVEAKSAPPPPVVGLQPFLLPE